MPTLPLDPTQGDPTPEVSIGTPTIDSRVPQTVDVQVGTPKFDVPPHLTHLMDVARRTIPLASPTEQDYSTAPVTEIPSSVGDKVLSALKGWRDVVHRTGEIVGNAAEGMSGFSPNDPLLGSTGMSQLPEASVPRTVGDFAGQAIADAPLFAFAPEAGPADLASEYLGRGITEHLGTEAPRLAKVLSEGAKHVVRFGAGTAEGAGYSAGDTALSGGSVEDVKRATLNPMNLIGGVAHTLLGVTSHEGLKEIAGENDNLVAAGKSEAVPLDDVKPSMVQITSDAGKPIVRVVEHNTSGVMKHADIPIDTPAGLDDARLFLRHHKDIGYSVTPEGASHLLSMEPQSAHELLTAPGPELDPHAKPGVRGPRDSQPLYGPDTEWDRYNPALQTVAEQQPSTEGGIIQHLQQGPDTSLQRPIADTVNRRTPNPGGDTSLQRPVGEPPTGIVGRDNVDTGIIQQPTNKPLYVRRDLLDAPDVTPEDKPAGMYYSPSKDNGYNGGKTSWVTNESKNPFHIKDGQSGTAGEAALVHFAPHEMWLSRDELEAKVEKLRPDLNPLEYDEHHLREILGAEYARRAGHDSIIRSEKLNPEFVALKNSAVNDVGSWKGNKDYSRANSGGELTQGHALTVDPSTGHVAAQTIPVEPPTIQASQAELYRNNMGMAPVGGASDAPIKLPPTEEAKFRDLVDTSRMISHPEASWKNTAFDGLQHDMHRGPVAAQQLKQQMYSARNLGNAEEIANAFKQQLPEKRFLQPADKALQDVMKGRLTFEQFRNAHPEVGQSLVEMTKEATDEAAANSKELEVKYGVIPPGMAEARARGDMDKYLATIYSAHILPKGKWVPPTEAVEAAFQRLNKEMPGASNDELQKAFQKLLNIDDESSGGVINPGASSDRLKQKNVNLPQTTKNLLGEVNSGAVRMAFTLAQQRTLLAKLRAWDEIAASPFFSHTPKPGWAHVPESTMFGAVKDGYLDPAVSGLLDTAHVDNPAANLKIWQMIGQHVKANWTYRNLNSQINNFARNVKATIMTDGMRLHEPIQSGQDFVSAIQALSNWKKSPFVTDEGSRLLDAARRHEALPAGMGKMEILAPGGVFDDMLKDLSPVVTDAKGKARLDDLLNKLQQNPLRSAIKKFDQTSKHIYDGTDQAFKLANFISGVRRLQSRGLSFEDAAATMGRRINESFPNYEHVGAQVDKMRKAPFGALAPMLSGAAEDIRNNIAYAKVISRAVSDPLERERVVSMLKQVGMVGAAAVAGNEMRRLSGTSDAEVEAAKGVRSQAGQQFHATTIALPKDSKGRVPLFDPSSWLPDLQYAQGNPDDALWRRVAANLINQPFQSSMAESTVKRALETSGLVRPSYNGQLPMEGERTPQKAIQDYMIQSLVPGVATHGYEALRKMGYVGHLGRNEEKLTPTEGAMKMITPGVTPVDVSPDSKALRSSMGEAYGQMKDLSDQQKRLARRMSTGGDLNNNPKEAARIKQAIETRRQQIQQRMTLINSLIEKANAK